MINNKSCLHSKSECEQLFILKDKLEKLYMIKIHLMLWFK